MKAKDRWRMQYKKNEAIWKRSISVSHTLWCSCGDYLNHFRPPCPIGEGGAGPTGADVSLAEGISFATITPSTGDGEDDGSDEEILR
nr:MAG: ORF2 [Torque teno polar bear virus 7]